MIFSSPRASLLLLGVALLLPPTATAFECKEIVAQKTSFNFNTLGGPHVVHWQEEDLEHDVLYKYNFTLDICRPLKSDCHNGARICAMRENIDLASEANNSISITPIDIAGTYTTYNNRAINAQFELLQESNSDAGRDGLRATLHGGRLPFDDKKNGLDQRAVIDFICDSERTGLEGSEGDKKDSGKDGDKKDDKKDGDKDDDKKGDKEHGDKESQRLAARGSKGKCEDSDNSLRFCGYDVEDDDKSKDKRVRTLRLEWRTKYACKDAPSEDGGSHWGFFGWFFIILFLTIASYLIFGSWLNYNRYGARGWDLLPHGDAIRDVPYIAKDFGRRIFQTVQGGGTRGGYAAV